jgi:FAD/FMN-containing dehydrogenase
VSERIDRRAFLAAAGAAGLTVAAGTSSGSRTARARRSAIVARGPRTLRQAIRGEVFERGSPGFATAAHVYNERFDGVLPQAVARPLDGPDVRSAVRWALAHGVPVRARSGGHSYAGYSTLSDGVVLDLRRLNRIAVDARARTATVGAGAQLIDVYATLASHGATIPAGSCPSVGVAGVTLGGGMGLAARKLGLTTDNLLAAELVTADGSIRHVDRRTDPDLLWGLRGGGGGNFGVVTKFVFRIHRAPASAAWFFVSWPWSSAPDAIAAWQAWAPHARDELTSILHLEAGAGANRVRVTGQYFGPASDLPALLAPLTAGAGASAISGDQDYLGLQLRWAGCRHLSVAECHTDGAAAGGVLERESFRAKSDYVTRALPAGARQAVVDAVEQRLALPGSGAILFDSYGGAINRVAADATAFVHRRALFCIQYLTYDGGAAWLGATHRLMRPYVSGLAYQNYIDHDLGGWQHAYYGTNYPRLLALRHAVDPHHFFNFPQAIGR